MKKVILPFAAVAALALPALGHAQTSPTATINATATVAQMLDVKKLQDLDFGELTPGQAGTKAPADGGKAEVTFNAPVTIKVAGGDLTRVGGGTLQVTYSCAQAATTAATPAIFTCTAGHTTAANTVSTHYVYVGGDITAAQILAAPAGAYAGEVTITAAFSGS